MLYHFIYYQTTSVVSNIADASLIVLRNSFVFVSTQKLLKNNLFSGKNPVGSICSKCCQFFPNYAELALPVWVSFFSSTFEAMKTAHPIDI
jgi:hypothetical protein